MQLNWDDARIFLAIARNGTLTAAAQGLGLGIATVSRRLARLEDTMSIRLFSRHQNGYQLTTEGEALLLEAEALEQAALNFQAAADLQHEVAGVVRIAVAENIANHLIIPSLAMLCGKHPKLSIEINSATELANIHRRDADIAIRTIQPETGNLTIKRLGQFGFSLYASKTYLQDHPMQISVELENWNHHRLIGWDQQHQYLDSAQYMRQVTHGQPLLIATNHLLSQVHAIQAGLGIGLIPKFMAQNLDLICIDSTVCMTQPIWLAVHSNLLHSPRVRVVVDHCTELFQRQADKL